MPVYKNIQTWPDLTGHSVIVLGCKSQVMIFYFKMFLGNLNVFILAAALHLSKKKTSNHVKIGIFIVIIIKHVIMDLLLPGSSDAVLVQARFLQHLHESFSGGIFVNSP